MAAQISLSKIIKQKGISLSEATKRIADLDVKVPRKLAAFVERCLRKQPDERFAEDGSSAASYHPPQGLYLRLAKLSGDRGWRLVDRHRNAIGLL